MLVLTFLFGIITQKKLFTFQITLADTHSNKFYDSDLSKRWEFEIEKVLNPNSSTTKQNRRSSEPQTPVFSQKDMIHCYLCVNSNNYNDENYCLTFEEMAKSGQFPLLAYLKLD